VNIPEGIALKIQLRLLPMRGFWIERLIFSQMQENGSILVSSPSKSTGVESNMTLTRKQEPRNLEAEPKPWVTARLGLGLGLSRGL